MSVTSENNFTLAYYAKILAESQRYDYKCVTLSEFWDLGCPKENHLILRHDLDANPLTLHGIMKVEIDANVRSSIFVRVNGNTYNPFDYRTFPLLARASALGFELGLHSNFVEFAMFHGLGNDRGFEQVLSAELQALRSFYKIDSIACHRDLNYAYNSLPWLQENWTALKDRLGLKYEAYDAKIMDSCIYVNETAEQKLGWRKDGPSGAMGTGRSVIISTHPHWWYQNNPFEI